MAHTSGGQGGHGVGQGHGGHGGHGWKNRAYEWYERHESKLDLAFFVGGFLFDVATLGPIDGPLEVTQQLIYLLCIAGILVYDFLRGPEETLARGPAWLRRAWGYRRLALHFFLGSLYSIYSLFFLKSASIFSTMAFVAVLLLVMVGNELKAVRARGVDAKVALFVVCLFCFFSILVPVALGFLGWLPFLGSVALTLFSVGLMYYALRGRVGTIVLRRRLLAPGIGVTALFVLFYLVGAIPPVPLSATRMGIFHRVEKVNGEYLLYSERPWWKFWQSGDEDFRAAPGDRLEFFVSVFSPARFDDKVYLRWSWRDPRHGWQGTDRVPMHVTGGRRRGFRGVVTKANYTPGEWRVSVESSDAREIGRVYFTVTAVSAAEVAGREFRVERE